MNEKNIYRIWLRRPIYKRAQLKIIVATNDIKYIVHYIKENYLTSTISYLYILNEGTYLFIWFFQGRQREPGKLCWLAELNAAPRYQSEEMKILNISFPSNGNRIHTGLVPLRHE